MSFVVIPPSPAPSDRFQLSATPPKTRTTDVPDLEPPTDERERSSTETTIVTIYSMYEDDTRSWSAARHHSKDLDVDVTIASRDSFLQSAGVAIEDSAFYDNTADWRRTSKRSSGEKARQSVMSNGSVQLAYDSQPSSTHSSVHRHSRSPEMDAKAARSRPSSRNSKSMLAHETEKPLLVPSQSPEPSHSRPVSRARSPNAQPLAQNGNALLSSERATNSRRSSADVAGTSSVPTGRGSTRAHRPADGSATASGVPASPTTHSPPPRSSSLLQIPNTLESVPQVQPRSPVPSQHSLAPIEGEDPDGFHVRSTYAELEVCGVKGDGYEEGVERTRARVGGSRASELRALEALGDGQEKMRELTDTEVRMLASLDRYGFYVMPSHERIVLLPAEPLLKPLAHVSTFPAKAPASPSLLKALPPAQPPVKETLRTAKWGRMLEARSRDQGGNIDEWGIRVSKERKLRERTFKGIPDCWRAAAWETLLCRYSKTSKAALRKLMDDYRAAIDQPSTYDVQIDLDVPRTISGHVMFRTRYGQGQRSLFHVLHSLSLRCETCGYCQGMGPIAATLLCYFEPERAYAGLVLLHDFYAMHTIFSPGFPGLLEAIYVQERLMEQMLPAVYASFKKHMISTTSYATKWYITLFANTVPFQTQLRLWDVFLLEGHDVFVVVALAIVWVYRDHITSEAASFETVLSLLSSFFVPQDENALLAWIEKVIADKKLRANMRQWRADWNGLVAAGKQSDALL